MATALKISYPEELIPELMSKVVGHSTLAKLSNQTPIPFSGTEQFIFNLEGNAQIVGEGEQKLAGQAAVTSKIIKPLKFVYQARISDEFMFASDEKKVEYYSRFADGFSKIIAKSFDIAAIHGLEPKSMTDASFKATNSFDGLVTGNVITFKSGTIETDLETAVQTVIANDAGFETIRNNTALKLQAPSIRKSHGFETIRNNTALKREIGIDDSCICFETIRNNTALKQD